MIANTAAVLSGLLPIKAKPRTIGNAIAKRRIEFGQADALSNRSMATSFSSYWLSVVSTAPSLATKMTIRLAGSVALAFSLIRCWLPGGTKEVARSLSRSPRTIGHQVSAVLSEFNAANRMEVLLRLRGEPWLLSTAALQAHEN